MFYKAPSAFNIALVGGGEFCRELIEKTQLDSSHKAFRASIKAVADADPDAPGMKLADEIGLLAVNDYHDLYEDRHEIHLIIVLTQDDGIFEGVLNSRPKHIRILSPHVFDLFWSAFDAETKKLRDRTEELTTLLNGIQDFILVINPDMDIMDVNDSFLDRMGYCREEVIGRKCFEIFQKINQPCNGDDVICPLNEVIRNKRPSQKILTRFNQHGDLRYFEINIHPVWEKDGRISKFIEISRDITERVKQEDEITRRLEKMVEERTRQLNETHAKLLHQDKMASLGKLSASVVHEINNPIAGVLNLIVLMKRIMDEGPVSEKEMGTFSQYLGLMETETRRISRIASNLLAFSRQSKMEMKPLDLNRLIEKTLFLNANLLKIHRLKVSKKLTRNLPDLFASEDQLQQVFMNLISNAAEAVDDHGGELTIITHLSMKKNKIFISFKNTGQTIPKENISKIFEPFYTTKKKGKGVGLGLSVAYGIIQEHGGTIYVVSKEGKGTTFKVGLPLELSGRFSHHQGGFHEQR
jgi:two-component system, NtrC family, sensor kinase